MMKNGEQSSTIVAKLNNEQLKNPDYLLQIHGYNPDEWEITSAKHSIWNNKLDNELYSSRITVKPRVGFNWSEENVKKIFVTAHDITPYWHVKMQAAFQLHTDNAVSKTVNFVESATRDDIKETYILAYKSHLKGITVYRNNSRTFQPMNLKKEEKKSEEIIKEKIKNPEKTIQTEKNEEYNPSGEVKTIICPECGNKIEMAEGCYICLNCGYSGCS